MKKNKKLLATAAAVFAIFITFDTHEYRKAYSQLGRASLADQKRSTLAADIKALSACTSLNDSSGNLTDAWRDCSLKQATTIQSTAGAALYVHRTAEWLRKEPEDKEMRESAVIVLAAGWADYKATMPVYSAMDTVESEARNSVVASLLPEPRYKLREAYMDVLTSAEIALLAPQLWQVQAARKRALAAFSKAGI